MDVGSRPSQRFRGPAGSRRSLRTTPYPDGQSCGKIEDLPCRTVGAVRLDLAKRWSWRRSIRPIPPPSKGLRKLRLRIPPALVPCSGFHARAQLGTRQEKRRAVARRFVSRQRKSSSARMAETTRPSHPTAAKHSATHTYSSSRGILLWLNSQGPGYRRKPSTAVAASANCRGR